MDRGVGRATVHGVAKSWTQLKEMSDGNPLQYSCLENPMDRGVGQATDHEVTKNQTGLKDYNKKQSL